MLSGTLQSQPPPTADPQNRHHGLACPCDCPGLMAVWCLCECVPHRQGALCPRRSLSLTLCKSQRCAPNSCQRGIRPSSMTCAQPVWGQPGQETTVQGHPHKCAAYRVGCVHMSLHITGWPWQVVDRFVNEVPRRLDTAYASPAGMDHKGHEGRRAFTLVLTSLCLVPCLWCVTPLVCSVSAACPINTCTDDCAHCHACIPPMHHSTSPI